MASNDNALAVLIVILAATYFFFKLVSNFFGGTYPNDNAVRRGPRVHRHGVPEAQIQVMMQMFPHVNRETIETDLDRTRNVENTCENILRNRATIIPDPEPQPSSSSVSRPANSFDPSTVPVTQCKDNGSSNSTVSQSWTEDPSQRSQILRERKEEMLRKARE